MGFIEDRSEPNKANLKIEVSCDAPLLRSSCGVIGCQPDEMFSHAEIVIDVLSLLNIDEKTFGL